MYNVFHTIPGLGLYFCAPAQVYRMRGLNLYRDWADIFLVFSQMGTSGHSVVDSFLKKGCFAVLWV